MFKTKIKQLKDFQWKMQQKICEIFYDDKKALKKL